MAMDLTLLETRFSDHLSFASCTCFGSPLGSHPAWKRASGLHFFLKFLRPEGKVGGEGAFVQKRTLVFLEWMRIVGLTL